MKSTATKVEVSVLPHCDFPHNPTVLAGYDGATKQGPWAYMCQPCFEIHGSGLGLGVGQRLALREEQTTRAKQEQRLAKVVREKWDPNGVEYLAGAISSLVTDAQLEVLIKAIASR